MDLTKVKHVWRTQTFTQCDIYEGDNLIATAEYPANIGIARLANLARKEHGENATVRNIESKQRVYWMPIEQFQQLAESFIKEN